MTLPTVVEQYLKSHHADAMVIEHPPVFTARQLAEADHVPPAMVAKVVFFFCDDRMVMGVLPADRHLNLHLARRELRAAHVRLATEREISERAAPLPLGAIPPFGSLLGVPVVMDSALARCEAIEAPAGSPTEALRIPLEAYLREEMPQVVALSKGPMHFHRRSSPHPEGI